MVVPSQNRWLWMRLSSRWITRRYWARAGASSSSRRSGPRLVGVLLIPARHLVLVEREDDRLAPDREVAPLRVALVVLGHEDPAQVRVAGEHHAEHVVYLALLEVGGAPQVHDGRE